MTRIAILLYLAARGEAHFKQLYEELGLTPGNAWSHLEKLSKDGLVKIKRELGKGRPKVIISLTPQGVKEVDRLLEIFDILVKLRDFVPGAGEGSEGPKGH
ncbi:MAG: ArsR family transcriptional regulator [Crenarchaeota archaeon]|nr:ArsR family transcriptional regulator [Thermoproteota archaeon]